MKKILFLSFFLTLLTVSCDTDKKSENKVQEKDNNSSISAKPIENTHNKTNQNQKIENQWLVILSGAQSHEEALQIQKKYTFETTVLNSAQYSNLNNGWFINCIPFKTKEDAEKELAALKTKKIKSYIKFSGKLITPITEDYFLIYGNRYMLLDTKVDVNAIDDIYGYEKINYGEYVASATCKKEYLPTTIQNMRNSTVTIHNAKGEQTTSKILDFVIIAVPSLHWSQIERYDDESIHVATRHNEAENRERAAEIMDMKENVKLVAILHDFNKDFKPLIARINTLKQDYRFTIKNPHKEVLNQVATTKIYKENTALANEQLGIDNSNIENHVQTITTYKIKNHLYTYVNFIFGDACAYGKYGDFYTNISLLWDHTNEKFEYIKTLDHYENSYSTTTHDFKFTPIFSSNNQPRLTGFITTNFEGSHLYINKNNQWINTKKIEFNVNGCE
ncbi:hypothetical protein [Aquimarina litoralis]|uniref:hypothetical protein n=1 Tax=Aquimarina litoralis TaxID=584605 RepID=UPI001C574293|nr:hypothetical protein [Aquimarina litoralis]MBW1298224.1 hypothetical protein [Aquimarina litoralis]